MDLAALKTAARSRLDDPLDGDELWTDDELTGFINEAINEACIRARLNLDSSTPEVTKLDVVAGKATYTLHESIFVIERGYLETSQQVLGKIGFQDLDERSHVWPRDQGRSIYFLTDLDSYTDAGNLSQQLQLYPIPETTETLSLTVYRLPLYPLCTDGDEPEIPPQHHPYLIDWVCHKAYLKQDADTLDIDKALSYETKFERRFGMPVDARKQEWQRKRRNKRTIARFM